MVKTNIKKKYNPAGLFMRKGYRLYACSLCVGEIDEDIVRNCTVNEDENVNKVLSQENTILVEENRQLKLKINELDRRTVILRKLVKDQPTNQPTS